MSLIYFHRFLILIAILFAAYFGYHLFGEWQRTGSTVQLVAVFGCGAAAVALALYLRTVRLPARRDPPPPRA